MPIDQLSNDQIILARAQRNRVMVVFVVSVVLLIATAGLLLLAARAQIIPVWLPNALVIALFFAWLGFFIFRVKPAFDISASIITNESYQRKTIDMHQRYARYYLLYILAFILVMGSTGFLISNDPVFRRFLGAFGFCFGMVVLLGLLSVAHGPGLLSLEYDLAGNDELSRALRSQATQLGYVFTVMEFCAVLIAVVYRPQLGLAILPPAIATAVAVPGLYLLLLEWRTNRADV